LFYVVNGINGVNEGTITRDVQFYFILQSRLPSAHHSHQGMTFEVELNFTKKTTTTVRKNLEMSYHRVEKFDIERYKVELHFPPDEDLNAGFDKSYYPKDTDPGRGSKTPPSTPGVWDGPSTYPEYDNWQIKQNGDAEQKGKAQDQRDWQAFGSVRQITSSLKVYEFKTTIDTPKGEQPVAQYKLYPGKKYKRTKTPIPPFPESPEWEDYEAEYSAKYVGPDTTTVETTLQLEDVKITDIRGQTYRSFVDGGPSTPA